MPEPDDALRVRVSRALAGLDPDLPAEAGVPDPSLVEAMLDLGPPGGEETLIDLIRPELEGGNTHRVEDHPVARALEGSRVHGVALEQLRRRRLPPSTADPEPEHHLAVDGDPLLRALRARLARHPDSI